MVVVACGNGGGTFKLEGHLINLNQGEFYVYSPDGVIDGIDTITVLAGRFNYKVPCTMQGTLVIVFPNFSEQPVFVVPGKTVTMAGDVSHLRELTVKGTPENKLMTTFRQQTKEAQPEEMAAYAAAFVCEHPTTLAATYLINRYFIRVDDPDYVGAAALYDTLCAAQPNNGRLAQEAKRVRAYAAAGINQKLPAFTATTIDGRTITQRTLSKDTAVIYLWASFDYESCNILRLLRDNAPTVTLVGINIDPSWRDCHRLVTREKIESYIVHDSLLFDSPLVQRLAMTTIPDNIIVENGVITARGLTSQQLRERFRKKKK